jgi:putative ABC transport system permease protein
MTMRLPSVLRRQKWTVAADRPTLSTRDLASEALAGMTQRPGRSVLTMTGTVLGVGAAVAVLGITSTASGQIGKSFNVLEDTAVTVQSARGVSFPRDAEGAVGRLPGVRAAGVWRQISFSSPPSVSTEAGVVADSIANVGQSTPLFAVSPGFFAAASVDTAGMAFNAIHNRTAQRVCVVGEALATNLHLRLGSTLYIGDIPFTVLGVIRSTAEQPSILLGVVMPLGTAQRVFTGSSERGGEQMLIRTRVGAAVEVANEAPLALSATDPSGFRVTPPANPESLRRSLNYALSGLYLALGGISLLIGTLGIANTTLVSVMERQVEIGLRRALGARPRHIAGQFLAESTFLGLLGGLVGTALAVAAVVCVALAHDWTAIINPWLVVGAPGLGALTGLVAGIYPALRSALVDPLSAIRTG